MIGTEAILLCFLWVAIIAIVAILLIKDPNK